MNAYYTKTKIYSLVTAMLVFGVVFLLPQLLFAQASTEGERGFLMAGLQGLLYSIVNVVFGTLAGLAGLLLNEAVTTYVVGFGDLYATSGLGYTVDNLWSTVRDIFNLTFIFGLVYIGFKMIFNSGDSSAKRMLGSLVLAALLVNFSLFITKFVIDFSNIAATQLAAGFNTAGTYAVSEGFMNLMGISGLFSTGGSLADRTTSAGFAFIFGSLILYIVAAFVFAAGGLLLIIRFAVLNIYMILSPLMFLGMVFPGFSNVSREYWQGFLGRAFFAPAYIFMLYLANQILVNMRGVSAGTSQMAEVFGSPNPVPNFSSTIPYFILTAVFMIAALVVAQKMGAQGATSALAVGKRMSGSARRVVMSPVSSIAGRAAVRAEKANNDLQTTRFGRNIKRGISIASLGTFTERNRLAAIDAGKKSKFGGNYSYQEKEDFKTKSQQRENTLIAEKKRGDSLKSAAAILADKKTLHSQEALSDSLDALAKTLKDMTKDEKEGLSLSQLTDKNIAVNLTDSDIEGLEKGGKFTADDIKGIKAARTDGFKSIAVSGNTLTTTDSTGAITGYSHTNAATINRRDKLVNMSTKDIGKLPTSVFTDSNMTPYITPPMLEERMKNGGLSNEDIAKVKKNIEDRLNSPSATAQEKKVWQQWTEKSTWGPMLGLSITEKHSAPAPKTDAPGIIIEEGYRTRPK